MSRISGFAWKAGFWRRQRLGVASVAVLACAGAVGLAAALFLAAAPASAETCQERGATCDDPKGGPACCAWACTNRSRCDDCCRNGFPDADQQEERRQCKEECKEKFPKKDDLDPGDFPPL